MKHKRNDKGLSLVELIVAVLIIAVLATAVTLAVTKYVAKSKRVSDANTAAELRDAATIALNETLQEGWGLSLKRDSTNGKYLGNDKSYEREKIYGNMCVYCSTKGYPENAGPVAGDYVTKFCYQNHGANVKVTPANVTGSFLENFAKRFEAIVGENPPIPKVYKNEYFVVDIDFRSLEGSFSVDVHYTNRADVYNKHLFIDIFEAAKQ
ncbi:MAG: prepilin-type N-terminal cleavage/methylation domain-containing protein [Lachnospiraceae bacterium]|nr:prepilin-type N-terminal cleavage/methylation domain-containing protein [Lachnospiraceae bacterium]